MLFSWLCLTREGARRKNRDGKATGATNPTHLPGTGGGSRRSVPGKAPDTALVTARTLNTETLAGEHTHLRKLLLTFLRGCLVPQLSS